MKNYIKVPDNFDEILDEAAKILKKKDRDEMDKRVFCGPGKSFPVNDCDHAAKAKQFLNKAKFSESTKKKIAGCINRRAKALGCSTDTPAKVDKNKKEKGSVENDYCELTEALVNFSIEEDKDLDFIW